MTKPFLCPNCNGEGTIYSEVDSWICPHCLGSGRDYLEPLDPRNTQPETQSEPDDIPLTKERFQAIINAHKEAQDRQSRNDERRVVVQYLKRVQHELDALTFVESLAFLIGQMAKDIEEKEHHKK